VLYRERWTCGAGRRDRTRVGPNRLPEDHHGPINETMKAINVSELKAHLSRYLRLASRGARIVVKDRDDPIAQLGPPDAAPLSWRERLAREGRLRLGSQRWDELEISPLPRSVDTQASPRAVREDPHEVRGR